MTDLPIREPDQIRKDAARTLKRVQGSEPFQAFLGASEDLIKNIHGVAPVTERDGDEIGYLMGRMAKSERHRWVLSWRKNTLHGSLPERGIRRFLASGMPAVHKPGCQPLSTRTISQGHL